MPLYSYFCVSLPCWYWVSADKSKVVKAKVYHGDFREKDLSQLLADASSGALSMRKVDGDIEVFKRTAVGKSRPQPPPRQDDAQTASSVRPHVDEP